MTVFWNWDEGLVSSSPPYLWQCSHNSPLISRLDPDCDCPALWGWSEWGPTPGTSSACSHPSDTKSLPTNQSCSDPTHLQPGQNCPDWTQGQTLLLLSLHSYSDITVGRMSMSWWPPLPSPPPHMAASSWRQSQSVEWQIFKWWQQQRGWKKEQCQFFLNVAIAHLTKFDHFLH